MDDESAVAKPRAAGPVADDELRIARERLEIALEAGGMGTWEWIIGGEVHWSPMLERIHGLEPGTFGGTFEYYQRDIHPDDREHVLSTIQDSLEGGDHHLVYRIVLPDQSTRWLEARGRLVRDADGRPERMLGVCTDVTERLKYEETLRSQASELEHQSAAMQDQTAEMQVQAEELQQQQTELEGQAEELNAVNEELEKRNSELQGSEAFVRDILESIGDPFVVHDADFRFRYVNKAAEQIFESRGHPSLVGRKLWDEYPQLLGTRTEREMRRAATQRERIVFQEYYGFNSSWSEMRCFPLPDGGLATLWRDITEQKRAEEALHYLSQASEIFGRSLEYEQTLDALARVVVPSLADWCSVEVLENGKLKQLSIAHVDPEKITWARQLNEKFPPDPNAPTGAPNVVRTGKSEFYPDITQEMIDAGAMNEEHRRIIMQIGFVSAMTVPLIAHGEVLGVLTLVTAESGRRYTPHDLELAEELARRAGVAVYKARLFREAQRMRAEAEEANRTKADFLARMSHELRTPLNAIAGYAQLLEIGVRGTLTPAQLEDVTRIQRSQRVLLSLVNDVLNFARLEAGHVQYDIARVPVAPMLDELESLVSPQLGAKAMRFEYTAPDASLAVNADAEKVRQILLNLVGNAIKFTGRSGRVALSAAQEGDRVHIRISDTGAGIPAAKLEAIFQPFVQLARESGVLNEGTGLGLAISRDLARAMHGDITVQSVVGQGSTFTLELPSA